MRRVLVTRPEPGAGRTAARLGDMGFEPVLLPLSLTHALPVDAGSLPENLAALALTSANAIRHAPAALIERLAALPCHCVGARTAQAARAAGLRSVREGPGDAGSLAALLGPALAGRTVVYICGKVRFALFEQRLAAYGVAVHPVETYDTVALEPPDEAVAARLSGLPVEAVLLYSATAAQGFRALAARPGIARLFAGAAVLALSPRIAASSGTAAIRIAATPDEAALLDLLSAPG